MLTNAKNISKSDLAIKVFQQELSSKKNEQLVNFTLRKAPELPLKK